MIYQINLISKNNNGTITTTDVTSNVVMGFSVIEKLDDTLDTGQLTLRNYGTSDRLTLFDTIQIKIDGVEVHSLRISSDNVKLTSKSPKKWQHDLTLVEHTKILELFTVPAKTFTQPTDDFVRYYLYDVFEDLINTSPLDTTSNYSSSRVVALPTSGDLYDLLTTTPSPELTFKDLTLRECFKQVADYVDAIPRLVLNTSGDLELSLDFVGELQNLIESTDDYITNQLSQDAQFYATNLESEALNLVSDETIGEGVEFYPDRNSYVNFRRIDDFFQSDFTGGVLPSPKNISRVVAIHLWNNLSVRNVTKSGTTPQYVVFEEQRDWRITTGILEQKLYQSLEWDIPLPNTAIAQPDYLNNSIYYNYRSPNVTIGELYGLFGTDEIVQDWFERGVLTLLIEEGLIDGVTNEFDDEYEFTFNIIAGFDSGVENWVYQLEYIPIPNSQRISVERQDLTDIDRNSTMLSNQQDRILNLENYANNLQGKINRIGNTELELANRTLSPFTSRVNYVGDYTDDMYILTVKESIYFNTYVDLKYKLTRDFNKISSFIGVNSEIRQWEISEQNTLERNLVYKQFIEIDAVESGNGSDTSDLFTINGIQCYLDTFNASSTFKSVSTSFVAPSSTTTRSLASISSNGGGNSLIFNFKFEDNISVGYYKEEYNSQITRQYSEYADNNGLTDSIALYVMDEVNDIPAFQLNVQEVADAYPKIIPVSTETDWTDRLGTVYLQDSLYIKKDSREIIGLTLQLAQISKNNNKVILGRYLSLKNRLVSETTPTSFKLYTYNGVKYSRIDTGTVKAGYDTVQTIIPTVDSSNNKISLSHSNLTSGKSAWALTDEDDNVLIAVNQDGTLLDTITFDFNEYRSGVNYKY